MTTTDNASLVREAYAAFNAKDLSRMKAVIVPDGKMQSVPFGSTLGFLEYFENWAHAFPDGRIELQTVVSEGNWVVAEFVGRGTQTGALRGPGGTLPASNRKAEIRMVEIYEVRDGKLATGRAYFDAAQFLAQLGVGQPLPTQPRQPDVGVPAQRH